MHREAGQHANDAKSLMTSLATNHVHFDVKNPTAYSIAWSREASLNTIPAINVTKYTSGQSDFFSGQQTFDGDNTITKDRPRLKRTTKNDSFLTHCDNKKSL